MAVGDTRAEADRFAEKNHVPFPVALDTDYQLHDAVGGPRIPFVVVVKRYSLERLVVASFHIGLIHSSAGFLQEMKEILETDAAFMKGK